MFIEAVGFGCFFCKQKLSNKLRAKFLKNSCIKGVLNKI